MTDEITADEAPNAERHENTARSGNPTERLRHDIESAISELKGQGPNVDEQAVAPDKGRREPDREREPAASPEGAPDSAARHRDIATSAEPPHEVAPAAWSKDAKASWTELPEHIRHAVVKRERDMEQGVRQLQARYSDLDKAFEAQEGALRQFNKTPAQVVDQFFSWFHALSRNPDAAFPALMQSYNYPPERLIAVLNGQPQQADIAQNYSPQQLAQYVDQRVSQQVSQFADQQRERWAQDTLAVWCKEKPHFDEVRQMMGHLLTPDPMTGIAAVPLKDGDKLDLDTAYERACWAHPGVRQKLINERLSAEAGLRQKEVERARRASVSIKGTAPGVTSGTQPTKPKGKSVRESINDAFREVNS